jgi:tetratricopeptide (TPR) repeat protein
MSAEVRVLRDCEVAIEEAKDELDRLLMDPRFKVTDRQKSILRYLAARRFDGKEDGVKAYAIALDVLGRPADFDAANDPIVRIELSRLRMTLDTYYDAYGHEGKPSIQIPKGKYVAIFPKVRLHQDLDEAEDDTVAEEAMARAVSRGEGHGSTAGKDLGPVAPLHGYGPWATAVALPVLIVMASLVASSSTIEATAKPVVVLRLQAAAMKDGLEATEARELLLASISRFQTLSIARTTSSDRRVSAYQIDMKYYSNGVDRRIWWQVTDGRSGDLLKAGLETVEIEGRSQSASLDELVDKLVRKFAATSGVINAFETHNGDVQSIGNVCVLRAEYELDAGVDNVLAPVRTCLERTVSARPKDSDALALLSRTIVAEGSTSPRTGDFTRARDLAAAAVSLAPTSDRALMALASVQMAEGRTDAAIDTGSRAVALNPSNSETAAKLASALFAAGYYEAAAEAAKDAAHDGDAVPRDAQVVLALDAYRRGDWAEASLLAEQIQSTDVMVRMLRFAALGQLGSDEVPKRPADVKTSGPQLEEALLRYRQTKRLQPGIIAALQDGLAKAGWSRDEIAVGSLTGP